MPFRCLECDEIVDGDISQHKHLPPRKHFTKYVKVQIRGLYNMFDPRARAATGLSLEEYGAVMDKYDALAARYPEVIKAEEEKS